MMKFSDLAEILPRISEGFSNKAPPNIVLKLLNLGTLKELMLHNSPACLLPSLLCTSPKCFFYFIFFANSLKDLKIVFFLLNIHYQ